MVYCGLYKYVFLLCICQVWILHVLWLWRFFVCVCNVFFSAFFVPWHVCVCICAVRVCVCVCHGHVWFEPLGYHFLFYKHILLQLHKPFQQVAAGFFHSLCTTWPLPWSLVSFCRLWAFAGCEPLQAVILEVVAGSQPFHQAVLEIHYVGLIQFLCFIETSLKHLGLLVPSWGGSHSPSNMLFLLSHLGLGCNPSGWSCPFWSNQSCNWQPNCCGLPFAQPLQAGEPLLAFFWVVLSLNWHLLAKTTNSWTMDMYVYKYTYIYIYVYKQLYIYNIYI